MRLHVRGLYIAMVHYSSLCVRAVVLTLGGDDIVEVVQGREQVDSEREKGRGARERERRQNENKQRTLKHVTSWMTCRWSEMSTETP